MIYIVDIDNTCADVTKRFAKFGAIPDRKDRKAFQQWLDKAHNPDVLHMDEPIDEIRHLLIGIEDVEPHVIYYLTGRSESQRKETEAWLEEYCFPKAPVIMREDNDWRGPHLYKSEKIKELMEAHPNEKFVAIDDDYAGDCEPMYRNRGILFLKVIK